MCLGIPLTTWKRERDAMHRRSRADRNSFFVAAAVIAACAKGSLVGVRGHLVDAGEANGATLAAYGTTKAFDLILAEGLWAEWRGNGVDVLALVLGRTDTPSRAHGAATSHCAGCNKWWYGAIK
jgi:short-subunit dehydrogenase